MPSKEPLINGIAYSWAQVKCSIGATEVIGIKKIAYSENQDMQNNYGAGNSPVSRSYGNITPEASITLHMAEIEALQAVSPTGKLQDISEFDILVAYLPEGGTLVKHKIEKCRFMNNSRDVSQGDMEIETELNLIVGNINWRA